MKFGANKQTTHKVHLFVFWQMYFNKHVGIVTLEVYLAYEV